MAAKPPAPRLKRVPVASLHFTRARWDLYFLRYRLDAARLAPSVALAGVIEPLTLEEWRGGYRIVCGFARAAAARAAGLVAVAAVVFARRALSQRAGYLAALASNAPGTALADLDKAVALHLGSQRFGLGEKELISTVAPLVGLPPSYKVVRRYLALAGLPPVVLDAWADGRVSRQHAEAVLLLPAADRKDFFLRAVKPFDLSASEARLVAEGLVDLAVRECRQVSQVLGDVIGRALAADGGAPVSPGRAKPRLRDILRRMHSPIVTQMEDEFARLASSLALPAGAAIAHSPFFEDDQLTIEAKVSDTSALSGLKDALERGLARGTFEKMLSIARRKAAAILDNERPSER